MPIHVTETELSILRSLWTGGALTIRELTEALYPGGSKVHYATVKKLIERLEAKGCVHRDRREATHRFAASIQREELIGDRLRSLAENLCEGSLAPVLMHLVKSQKLTAKERQSLRALIDELDQRRKRE